MSGVSMISRGNSNPKGRHANQLFGQIFLKIFMKMKKIGQGGLQNFTLQTRHLGTLK